MTTSALLFNTPLRSTWDVRGDLTETLWWPAKGTGPSKTVLFMVPGNPGLVEYYENFLQEIYVQTKARIEIFGVSHLGHSPGNHNQLDQRSRLYTLREQIDHKAHCLDLLQERFPPETQYILVGHSMGAYVCAEVLRERPNHNISTIVALFPTLKHIANTPNGTVLSPIFGPVPRTIISAAASGASLLPRPVLLPLVKLFTGQPEPGLSTTALKLLRGHVVNNALYMAGQEMEMIAELDEVFYEEHVDKFVIYYGVGDRWVPVEHHREMLERFPEANIHLCEENLPHAFVLGGFFETSPQPILLTPFQPISLDSYDEDALITPI
ncbi:hypothetical protein BC936DRAFT_143265 [Jimgerdemannia flammicorona]|uniref:Alpha/Beta hydrolase protein n=1 Tax=Jimgerdemannia flammicorona TaxID=994334 RepID=A0A433DE80_9FUNG|nr:hypothetical protein BC936DRAFT_143265 [Jimgerdemannia flammicorona]